MMLSLQSDPRQYHQQQLQGQHQQQQVHQHQHHHHQQLLQQVVGGVVDYNNNSNNNHQHNNGGGVDRRSDLIFALHNESGAALPSSANNKQEFLSREVDEDMLLTIAHQNYKAGNYKLALEHSKAVYERNPCRTDNLLLLGAICYQLHDYEECIRKNQEAIALEPHFAECYGNMANALKEKGNIDVAIQYYLVAIELRPNFADAWSNLASAYMRKGRLNEATQCCRQALALNHRLVDAHSNLGNLMKAQGLVQEVVEDLS